MGCVSLGRGGVVANNLSLPSFVVGLFVTGIRLVPQGVSIWGHGQRSRMGADCSNDYFPCEDNIVSGCLLLR